MNRALGIAVIAFGCGGAPKPAPIAATSTEEPAPAPPVEKPAPIVAKGGDPCDGGEIASRGPERTGESGAGANPSTSGLGGHLGTSGSTGVLRFGNFDFGPGLDADGTKRVFTRSHNRLLYCYNTALQRDANLSGTVTLDIAIEKTGQISSAHAEGVDDALDRCIQHGVTSFQLPAAKQHTRLTLKLIFTRP